MGNRKQRDRRRPILPHSSSGSRAWLSRLVSGLGLSSRAWAWGLVVLVVTLLTHLRSLTLGFTNWDDADYVTKCPYIKYFTTENIWFFFTNSYFSNYHPLTSLTYMVEYWLWRLEPMGYHATNLLVHCANAVLVYLLALMLVKRPVWAAFGALLYSVHPLRVEVVAWVAGRKDLLCTLFTIPALIFYLKYAQTKSKVYYRLSLLMFLLALLSKPMAVTVPAVLFGLDWLARRPLAWNLAWEKIPFFALSLVMAVVTVLAQQAGGSIRMDIALEWVMKLQTATYGFVFYLGKSIWPTGLSPLYPYGVFKESFLPPAAYFAPYVAVALVALAWYVGSRSRLWAFAILMYVVMLLPVIQIVPIGGAYASDRYTYLPIIGLCIALAASIGQWSDRLSKPKQLAVASCATVTLLAYAILTWNYTGVWRNGITLWTHAIEVTPRSHTAHNNLGTELLERGRKDEAYALFSRAIALNPKYAHAYNNRGNYFVEKGDFVRAVADYNMAITIEPRHAPPYNNLGTVLVRQGRLEEAYDAYSKAISLNPFYSEAYLNRATLYSMRGDVENAISDMLTAVEINPNLPIAYNDLGNALGNLGRHQESEKMFYLALRYDPGNPVFLTNRGTQRKSRGELDQALADFTAAGLTGFQSEQLFVNWGGVLAEKGHHKDAIELYTKAIELNPNSYVAYCNRGASYLKMGVFEKANQDFNKALELNPEMVMALKHRGILHSTTQNNEAAIKDFSRAIEIAPEFVDAYINRAVNAFILKRYEDAWADVRKLRELRARVDPGFIKQLQDASGIRE